MLEAQVARSSAATVYRALRGASGARVAVKVYDYTGAPSAVLPALERARRLSGPFVATILDAGKLDGRAAVVSEWVDGVSLRQLLQVLGPNGRLPLSVALRISSQVARALAAAHELEGGALIHGALDPSHVLCGADGSVKVCGFGGPVARGVHYRADRSYVAPEVRRGDGADVLSDVFAVGTLTYVLVTGLTPLQAAIRMPLSSTQVAPLPSRVNPGVDPSLDEVLLDAIDRDSANRPHSMRRFSNRIDRCFVELDLEQSPAELAALVQRLFPEMVPKGPPRRPAELTAPTQVEPPRAEHPAEARTMPDEDLELVDAELIEDEPEVVTRPDERRHVEELEEDDEASEPTRSRARIAVAVGVLVAAGIGFFALRPVKPELTVGSKPAGATVEVDGRVVGKAPVRMKSLSPGSHRLRLTLEGHQPLERELQLTRGQKAELTFDLVPEPLPPPAAAVEPAKSPPKIAKAPVKAKKKGKLAKKSKRYGRR